MSNQLCAEGMHAMYALHGTRTVHCHTHRPGPGILWLPRCKAESAAKVFFQPKFASYVVLGRLLTGASEFLASRNIEAAIG